MVDRPARAVPLLAAGGLLLAGCPSPRATAPSAPPAAAHAVALDGALDAALTGVAGDGALVFSARTAATPAGSAASAAPAASPGPAASPAGSAVTPAGSVTWIEAFRPGAAAAVWRTELAGRGGPLATGDGLVFAALAGTGSAGGAGNVAALPLRGEPGAVVTALHVASGLPAWQLAVDATDWAVITAIAPASGGALISGSFSGTLRIAGRVVSSAGKSDGFVARLTAAGSVAWLVRAGGPGADALQGVAASGARIAIAGTFASGAELLGQPLAAFDERSPSADGFVAELDATGARRWVQVFGGKADDTVAGVAIDASGHVVVAAAARETVHLGGADHVASGPADGLVAWWDAGGTARAAIRIGGADFDGLAAITAAGRHVVVAGFYSGALRLGAQALTAAGGDDAFLAALDTSGSVVEAWPVSGDGREEIPALSAIPGGFVAGIRYTAPATLAGAPLSGARTTIAVRGVR